MKLCITARNMSERIFVPCCTVSYPNLIPFFEYFLTNLDMKLCSTARNMPVRNPVGHVSCRAAQFHIQIWFHFLNIFQQIWIWNCAARHETCPKGFSCRAAWFHIQIWFLFLYIFLQIWIWNSAARHETCPFGNLSDMFRAVLHSFISKFDSIFCIFFNKFGYETVQHGTKILSDMFRAVLQVLYRKVDKFASCMRSHYAF